MVIKLLKTIWLLGAVAAVSLAIINFMAMQPLNAVVAALLIFTVIVTNPFKEM